MFQEEEGLSVVTERIKGAGYSVVKGLALNFGVGLVQPRPGF